MLKKLLPAPPQTIISLSVHTAVGPNRASGALMMLVAVQALVLGLYLSPVFKTLLLPYPPQTIISLSVHTAVWTSRPSGALTVLVAVQLSLVGLYRPPLFRTPTG